MSIVPRLHDPFGLIGPVICKAKIFLEKFLLMKLNWDEDLPQSSASEWRRFISTLKSTENIRINTYILNNEIQAIAHFGICDASISAYGFTLYLNCYTQSGSCTCKLMASKS